MFRRIIGCAMVLGLVHMAYAGVEGKWTKPDVYRANNLIGLSVKTPGNETLGTLDQIIFENGRVAFWLLTPSFAEANGKFFLVPWEKFRLVSGEGMHFTFDITRDRLLGAPSFTWNQCPDLNKPEVSKGIYDYFGVKPVALPMGHHMNHNGKNCFTAAACLIGTRVEARDKEEVGTIEDVAIDFHEGRLVYGVVSLGRIKGMTDRICVVPWSALRIFPNRDLALVDVEPKALERHAVTWNDFPKLDDLSVATLIYQRFHRDPYWDVYGYNADRYASWQAGSTYNRLYSSGNVATYEGKIISIGSFLPGPGAAPGVRLVIKTNDNKYLVAHLGPFSYVFGPDFRLRYGDTIKLSGSSVVWDGYSIVMAGEVTLGDHVLKLRDAQGLPLWHLGEATAQG